MYIGLYIGEDPDKKKYREGGQSVKVKLTPQFLRGTDVATGPAWEYFPASLWYSTNRVDHGDLPTPPIALLQGQPQHPRFTQARISLWSQGYQPLLLS